MPYRTDLKRPDLKGQFPCSVCKKVFCHSSSLSRHRMQAHYKSYTCTQCNQEIQSSETLRSHMYRYHHIQRMFMCRCCNWAFPDKTSLHIHMQSMQKSGQPGDVSVLARGSIDHSEDADFGIADETDKGGQSFGSPSAESSPDEELRDISLSPAPLVNFSETEEQQQGQLRRSEGEGMLSVGEDEAHQPEHPPRGIFPGQQQPDDGRAHSNMASSPPAADFLLPKWEVKSELGLQQQVDEKGSQQDLLQKLHQTQGGQQQHFAPAAGGGLPPALLQQHWLSQWLANNPYVIAGAGGQLPQQGPVWQNSSGSAKLLQVIYAAAASAVANKTIGGGGTAGNQPPPSAIPQQSTAPTQQPPPAKRAKGRGEKRKASAALASMASLDLNIPHNPQQQPHLTTSNKISAAGGLLGGDGAAGKLNSLIDNLLLFREGSVGRGTSPERNCSTGERAAMERKNKRKLRIPTRATDTVGGILSAAIGDGEQPPQGSGGTLDGVKCADENGCFPGIAPLLEQQHARQRMATIDRQQPQQPSPAVSDSQTSGSSHGQADTNGLASPRKYCASCQAKLPTAASEFETTRPADSDKVVDAKLAEHIFQIAERISAAANSLELPTVKEELLDCVCLLEKTAANGQVNIPKGPIDQQQDQDAH